jgi:hypothetical protein
LGESDARNIGFDSSGISIGSRTIWLKDTYSGFGILMLINFFFICLLEFLPYILISRQMENKLPGRKGKWVEAEDELLRVAIREFGEAHWVPISKEVGRTPIQCLHRWRKVLKPGLIKGPWSI